MDPITHVLLGSVAGGAAASRKLGRLAFGLGALAGDAPDLDIVRGMGQDHLDGLIYHRHFTHSLAFIPVGAGLLAGLVLLLRPKRRSQALWVFLACFAGMATHGLLDCCTSYGTLWLWPFSDTRVAWDVVSIVDPLVTLGLLAGLLWALKCTGKGFSERPSGPKGLGLYSSGGGARVALVTLLALTLYMGLGLVQRQRAYAVQEQLATLRGQKIEHGRVLPTIGNLIVWRSIYESKGQLYADAVRLPLIPGDLPKVRVGGTLPVFQAKDLPADSPRFTTIQRDFARFAWFSDGWVARLPGNDAVIGDLRFTARAEGFDALWGMHLAEWGEANPDSIASGIGLVVHLNVDRGAALQQLWDDICGRGGGFVPLDQITQTQR